MYVTISLNHQDLLMNSTSISGSVTSSKQDTRSSSVDGVQRRRRCRRTRRKRIIVQLPSQRRPPSTSHHRQPSTTAADDGLSYRQPVELHRRRHRYRGRRRCRRVAERYEDGRRPEGELLHDRIDGHQQLCARLVHQRRSDVDERRRFERGK